MSSNTVYARVENGAIAEYPVLQSHILNRNHPLSFYTPVNFDVKPEAGPFERVVETVQMRGASVHVSYTVVQLSLAQLLAKAQENAVPGTPLGVAQIAPELTQQIIRKVTEHTQARLDLFAQSKQYGSMLSLVSYHNSRLPNFKAEAERGMQFRDDTWESVHVYLAAVLSGAAPMPVTVADIEAVYPPLSWTPPSASPPPAPTPAPAPTEEPPAAPPAPAPAPTEEPPAPAPSPEGEPPAP